MAQLKHKRLCNCWARVWIWSRFGWRNWMDQFPALWPLFRDLDFVRFLEPSQLIFPIFGFGGLDAGELVAFGGGDEGGGFRRRQHGGPDQNNQLDALVGIRG